MNRIEKRKEDHIRICLENDVRNSYNYWDDVQLLHSALPELNYHQISLETKLFGKTLRAPIVISAITGGFKRGGRINENLASAAADIGVGFGVGSQRPALEHRHLESTYSVVKEYDVPLVIANIGAPQLVEQKGKKDIVSVDMAKRAMDMVDADILAVHMNYLQEIVQPEGDLNAKGCIQAIKVLAAELPVLAKETGAGFARETALTLKSAGVKGFDAGGAGGTSFAAVEYYRAKKEKHRRMAETFRDWGIPTPVSVVNASVGLPVIATGGVRSGVDVARVLVLGASSAGLAGRLLKAGVESKKKVVGELETIIEELRGTMFLCGAKNISAMSKKPSIVTGKTKQWLEA